MRRNIVDDRRCGGVGSGGRLHVALVERLDELVDRRQDGIMVADCQGRCRDPEQSEESACKVLKMPHFTPRYPVCCGATLRFAPDRRQPASAQRRLLSSWRERSSGARTARLTQSGVRSPPATASASASSKPLRYCISSVSPTPIGTFISLICTVRNGRAVFDTPVRKAPRPRR